MRKTFFVIIAVAVLGAVSVGAYYLGYDHGFEQASPDSAPPVGQNETPVTPEEQPESLAFYRDADSNYLGTAILTGYLDVQTRVCNPGDMCDQTVDYASFIFTSTTSETLREFVGSNDGNSFIAGDRIGIGCQQVDQDQIYYQNFADSGSVTGTIEGADYARLVASKEDNQVQLKITRELYTSGQGAPDCYAHFRNFDVL